MMGLVPSVVEDAIANGQSALGRSGARIFYSSENNISVVLNGDDGVVTVGYGWFKP